METITRAVQNTSDAFWKEVESLQGTGQEQQQHGEEPIAGVQGKGTPSDPYDSGNKDGNSSLALESPRDQLDS
jgi:hypothetical protein